MKTSLIPVVGGTLDLIGKDTDILIKRLPRSLCFKEIRKIVFASTAHTLRMAFLYVKWL